VKSAPTPGAPTGGSAAEGLLPAALAPRHISAELIFASETDWHETDDPLAPDTERVVISVRMGMESRWTEVTVHNPDEAVTRAAREVLEMTNPYVLSQYADLIEHDRDTALRLINEAIALDPENPYPYLGWGNLLDDKNDHTGAIAKYQQALALDPKNAYAYNNWGNALFNKQDYAGAIAKYQKALALDPKNQMFRAFLEAAEAEKKKIK
jgi:tetratricopeptide (TPR) repeat protein